MNWMLLPTLVCAVALCTAGERVWRRLRSPGGKAVALLCAGLLAIPGVLFAVYYLHRFDHAAWFYQLRSFPLTELTAAGAGLLAGVLAAAAQRRRLVTRSFLLTLLALGIIIPYLKPVIAPLPANPFQDRWADGVCLQSTASSCGAASAATLLHAAGIHVTEAEIARRCFTYRGGTENWYLARYLRRQGMEVRFITSQPPKDPLPVPSIAGIRLGNVGHFIPILEETATSYITGDPLVGRQEWPKAGIRRHFAFAGFFLELRPPPASDR